MASVTHFEVYVLEGHQWTLQGRFISNEKDKAVEEAKNLEAHLKLPAKVVKEQLDTVSGLSNETVIYVSYRAKAAMQAARDEAKRARSAAVAKGGPQGLRPNAKMPKDLEQFAGYQFNDNPGRRTAVGRNLGDFVGRLIMVVLAAVVLAAGGTALLPMAINLVNLGGARLTVIDVDTLFLIFLALFTLFAFLFGAKSLPKAWSHTKLVKGKQPSLYTQMLTSMTGAVAAAEEEAKVNSALQKKAKDKDSSGEDDDIDPRLDPSSDQFDPVALMEENLADFDPAEERRQARAEEEERRKASEARAKEEAEKERQRKEELERQNAADKARQEAAEAKVDGARDSLMGFLGGTVATLKSVRPQLDVFQRFGVNLYLAGACEAVVKQHQLDEPTYGSLLSETLEIMGAKPAVAKMFREKLEEYMVEPRYQQMVHAGRDAMMVQLTKAGDPFLGLSRVMDDWDAPQRDTADAGGTMAIVFTDMVGYTNMNTRLGDSVTRDVMRAHNAIIRSALSRFEGREVKHTGDGIMAVFPVVSRAVEAMVSAQQAIQTHNSQNPDRQINVRIGINAGEPMHDEGDYYGIAVTIAARICARAAGGEILVSAVVRELSRGTTVPFAEKGVVVLKGMAEPQRIYTAGTVVSVDDGPIASDQDNAETAAQTEGTAPVQADAQTAQDSAEKPSTAA